MIFNIALELGTSNTSIYLEGNGVVYYQPTCIAYAGVKKPRNIVAVGKGAKMMQGRSPDKTIVIEPVKNGIIADVAAARDMLKAILRELLPQSVLQPSINAVVLIPCGISADERKDVEQVCMEAGIRSVTLIEKILAAAVGCDLPVSTPEGCFIATMGGGTTEVAAISLDGIVHGISAEVGGNRMDVAILDALVESKYIQLGLSAVEQIKTEIGSLFANDTASMSVSGQDIMTKTPKSATVFACEIMQAVLPVYHAIADAIESVVNLCPPETAGNIYKSGIVLTGGCAQIWGLEQLFNARLKLDTFVAPDPQYATIAGGGKLLSDPELRARILAQN